MKRLILFICSAFAAVTMWAQSGVQIGAYYFDGWLGNKSGQEEWALKANAPTGLTYKLMTEYVDREPLWGWRNDDLKIMERQIDLAGAALPLALATFTPRRAVLT